MNDTSNLDDPESSKIRLAHHEAAHAVVAWVLGIPLKTITAQVRTGYAEPSESEPELRLRMGEREALLALLVQSLAGGHAQIRLNPKYVSTGRHADQRDARSCVYRLHPDGTPDERKLIYDDASITAKVLVGIFWPRIQAVAAELLENLTLSGDQATAIIERS